MTSTRHEWLTRVRNALMRKYVRPGYNEENREAVLLKSACTIDRLLEGDDSTDSASEPIITAVVERNVNAPSWAIIWRGFGYMEARGGVSSPFDSAADAAEHVHNMMKYFGYSADEYTIDYRTSS